VVAAWQAGESTVLCDAKVPIKEVVGAGVVF
jgi:hypothetical protein